ncbi:hypothetical protein PHYSODRAFT_496351 [Phytophthora sojae]|uniref:Uncharacterized protein n=1 Tax=Phytophthora sojae (strain P6497) TaxID=1094619 RepID=G4Z3W5_PHYSP|nr:hypothetical protein PHYSODRAFT_496351 [Phytophthora sojae]EGZ20824.1 hypothetical protein PHYSODRAFT_496351 [Phytophthora sojae]|eukprot:XP_009523541.1 hypothetical protein PHYSODRAFT_496351 [Phytophthora sojae]
MLPLAAALINAVIPISLLVFTSTLPCSTRYCTACIMPLSAAHISAVLPPNLSFAFTSAPH